MDIDGQASNLIAALNRTNATEIAVTIGDPTMHDCPLIYANEEFCKLTGYRRSEVEGLNCRFLQGSDTDKEAVEHIRSLVKRSSHGDTCLLNYRKDGSSFINLLSLRNFRFRDGNQLILGFQCLVSHQVGKTLVNKRLRHLDGIIGQASVEIRDAAVMAMSSSAMKADIALTNIRHVMLQQRTRHQR